jgi:TatD DNase family protein
VKLVDSHCHLDDAQFTEDRAAVIERAHAAGLEWMLAIGTGNGPPDLESAVHLADDWPSIYATVGVHPNDAPKVDDHTFKRLEHLLSHRKVKAIGEIGLDYHWGVPKEQQLPVFTKQLAIASAARMPIVIHTRDAWTDTLDVLRKHWAPTDLPCVMHCFTGNAQQARECLDMGFYLAFGGVITFPKSAFIREAARITPLDRLLIETDSPYLAPVPHRGKRNEPAFVAHTAALIADIRNLSSDQFADKTTQNFMQVFRIPSPAIAGSEDQLH